MLDHHQTDHFEPLPSHADFLAQIHGTVNKIDQVIICLVKTKFRQNNLSEITDRTMRINDVHDWFFMHSNTN